MKNLTKARLKLERADNTTERCKAVETALSLGMSLQEIEQYLDWLDNRTLGRHPARLPGGLEPVRNLSG